MAELVTCQFCKGEIAADALKCRHCGEWVKEKRPAVAASTTTRKRGSPVMRVLGALVFFAGGLLAASALSADTTVGTGDGRRVHNLGLMQQQRKALTLGAGVAIAGLLLVALGEIVVREVPAPPVHVGPTKPCGTCANPQPVGAKVCSKCGEPLS